MADSIVFVAVIAFMAAIAFFMTLLVGTAHDRSQSQTSTGLSGGRRHAYGQDTGVTWSGYQ